ncbi:MAG: hypothetical protein E7290_06815 [Lachnospiraceae bacterium]|nr:hypothetical protein [Lachnospiraceae bacterium]
MSLSQIQQMQVNKQVDMILHAPGSQVLEKQQLEMAFVFDMSADKEYLSSVTKDIVTTLKRHDKIFQNVRCNVVRWEEKVSTEVMPMSFIQMGKPFTEDNLADAVDKKALLEELCAYLKLFHARSKCIIVITEGNYVIEDRKKLIDALNPFLKSKILFVTPDKMFMGREFILGR